MIKTVKKYMPELNPIMIYRLDRCGRCGHQDLASFLGNWLRSFGSDRDDLRLGLVARNKIRLCVDLFDCV